ncbi:hypothetical protein CMV_017999 [Castanea mollissima]|uniref:Aldehyde oxidase/xanthine dehydrogenase second molybdopterin binding domain-containing protein n=1 Tax=Castanea mollissima TaxID=60419 RepID=A0A8J4R3D2_9ROSI|nr:hypothetical protein CMV_017999 [Castanea mollissima]
MFHLLLFHIHILKPNSSSHMQAMSMANLLIRGGEIHTTMPMHMQAIVLYSDFSSLDAMENVEDDDGVSIPTTDSMSTLSMDNNNNNNWEESVQSLLYTDESLEEQEKLSYLCYCAIASLKVGGSVLIPINRLGTLLQLLEQISASLESSTLKVPIYVISSIAEELLAYTNVIPEWLCKERQEKDSDLVLSVPMSINIPETSTDKVPNSSPTAASASSDIYGSAVLDACEQIKARMAPIASEHNFDSFAKIE